MKKKLFALVFALIMTAAFSCQAASYTLPEKMHNQLAIGSGLKGSFRITAEGEKTKTPFLNAVTDADFSIRGIISGNDLHYYIFQSDENENQSALSELYRKDGIYYFRSDMVQGKILAFPAVNQYIDTFFPVKGENPTLSSVLTRVFSLTESEKKHKWTPVLNRYQNELEMWLADFTVQADVVKQENGSSALDFTYVIPVSDAKARIISLFREFTSDPEVSALFDTVMTPEQKNLYLNSNLIYYYQEALDSLDLQQDIRMNKRVSAMGDVLSSSLSLPLDPADTGYQTLSIENHGEYIVYQVLNENTMVSLVLPAEFKLDQKEFQKTVWYTRYSSDAAGQDPNSNTAVRIDIEKTSAESVDDEERTHLSDNYSISVRQDDTYLPEGAGLSDFSEMEEIKAALELHYYSKYSQNSATTLEITGSVQQGDSVISLNGKLKTAAPWLFMPFEVIDLIPVEADKPETLAAYFLDWVSNADSMIRHTADSEKKAETEQDVSDSSNTGEGKTGSETGKDNPEAAEPLDVNEENKAEPSGEPAEGSGT